MSEKFGSYIFNAIIVVIATVSTLVLLTSFIYTPQIRYIQPTDIINVARRTEYLFEGNLIVYNDVFGPECTTFLPYNESYVFDLELNATNPSLYEYFEALNYSSGSDFEITVETICLFPSTVSDDTALTVAYVMIGFFSFAVCIMNLYACSSHRGHTPNLFSYFLASCFLCSAPLIMCIYICVQYPVVTAIFLVRATFLCIFTVLACFIISCVYVTNVTETWTTTTTSKWSDGSTSYNSHTDQFGYVKCRNWGCIQCC